MMSNIACSRLLETRAKERARGRKRGGLGERKRGKEEEPVIIFLNTLCRPLFPKCVNMTKCQTFHCHGSRLPARVLEFARLSIQRFDVAAPKGSPGLGFQPSKSCRFCQKIGVSWNESSPGVLVQRRSK